MAWDSWWKKPSSKGTLAWINTLNNILRDIFIYLRYILKSLIFREILTPPSYKKCNNILLFVWKYKNKIIKKINLFTILRNLISSKSNTIFSISIMLLHK